MTSCTHSDDAAGELDGAGASVRPPGIRSEHDIRASLAVVNGFNQILESSIGDLCEQYKHIRDKHPDFLETEQLRVLSELESDVWYCLARVKRSVEQLSTRIGSQDLSEQSLSQNTLSAQDAA